jgi:hypothetical protein
LGRDSDPLRRAFAPLIGLPAWLVRKGYGSFLTLEFGQPHLRVREPIVADLTSSDTVRKSLARRRVRVRGDWHLLIRCHWRVLSNDVQVGSSEASDEKIDAAAHEIDGQLLSYVEIGPSKGISAFGFDHGAILQTWPYDDDDNHEQWLLYMKSGDVFAYRADGCYCVGPGNQKKEESVWLPLGSAARTP